MELVEMKLWKGRVTVQIKILISLLNESSADAPRRKKCVRLWYRVNKLLRKIILSRMIHKFSDNS